MTTVVPTPSRVTAPSLDADARARDLVGVSRLTNAALTSWLHGLPGVDQVGCEARAAALGTRSIKTTAKVWGIDTAISMIDLTTLEGADTVGKVRGMCVRALRPDPTDSTTPRPAAVCVYGDMVAAAREALGRGDVKVAAVATAFPSGRASMQVKLADTRDAVAAGADEIDMVIDRGAFLSGDYLTVFREISEVAAACARDDGTRARLKVILETGELVTYDNVRRASWLAMLAGGDFIKTSTGKVSPAATLPVTLVMLEAVRDWREATGQMVGVKPAGGIRSSKDALKFLVAVSEVAGDDWLDPFWFRFGASSLLNDLLLQRQKLRTGAYSGPDYVADDSPSLY
jgi:deoxyribose-phosphate aldolase